MECVNVIKKEPIYNLVIALIGVALILGTFVSGKGGVLKYVVLILGILIISGVIYIQFGYNPEESFSNKENFYQYNTGSPTEQAPANINFMNSNSNLGNETNNNVSEMDVPKTTNEMNTQNNSNIGRSEPIGMNEDYENVSGELSSRTHLPNDCYPKDVLSPEELLPRDTDSVWAQTVPAGQGALSDKNFLNAGFHVGVNTVGQSLRNANRQIRSEPPNPQVKVSPWMQTTIEPDSNRKPLEIGA